LNASWLIGVGEGGQPPPPLGSYPSKFGTYPGKCEKPKNKDLFDFRDHINSMRKREKF